MYTHLSPDSTGLRHVDDLATEQGDGWRFVGPERREGRRGTQENSKAEAPEGPVAVAAVY